MHRAEASIDVAADAADVFARWARFEAYPEFMDGIAAVEREGDDLRWTATVDGREVRWQARVVEESPPTRIAWSSVDGDERGGGLVLVSSVGTARSRVQVAIDWADDEQVRRSLQRFRELVEAGPTPERATTGYG